MKHRGCRRSKTEAYKKRQLRLKKEYGHDCTQNEGRFRTLSWRTTGRCYCCGNQRHNAWLSKKEKRTMPERKFLQEEPDYEVDSTLEV